jgi:hypothetical protein
MDQVLIMIVIGIMGTIVSVTAFVYILKNWDYFHDANGSTALFFGIIMCGMATSASVLSLIFGIAKLLN